MQVSVYWLLLFGYISKYSDFYLNLEVDNFMKHIYDYRPEIVAFYSGAAVMIFELLGSRVV